MLIAGKLLATVMLVCIGIYIFALGIYNYIDYRWIAQSMITSTGGVLRGLSAVIVVIGIGYVIRSLWIE